LADKKSLTNSLLYCCLKFLLILPPKVNEEKTEEIIEENH